MPKNFKPQIALIEDDFNLVFFLQKFLHNNDYKVITFQNTSVLFKRLNKMSFDLFIIDIGLPDINGLSILKKIREFNARVPVIIITEKGNAENEVISFLNGANLYHKKPINYDLLLIQIRNLLKVYEKEQVIELGDLYIDLGNRVVKKDSKLLKLTFSEFQLLTMMVKEQYKIFSREEILTKVLSDKTTDTGAVDTLISRLRKKLGKYKGDSSIETIYKSGFRLSLNYFTNNE
jgi:DNA-binding response OmpR family regulator